MSILSYQKVFHWNRKCKFTSLGVSTIHHTLKFARVPGPSIFAPRISFEDVAQVLSDFYVLMGTFWPILGSFDWGRFDLGTF